MLKVSGLTVRYNRKNVLQSLNWQWPENVNCIALVGENGSGKSTLIKAITGLTAIVAGEIIFNKNEIANIPTFERIKRGISVLPQNSFFIPELTLGENLNIIKSPKVRKSVELLLKKFETAQFVNQKITGLSGGELRKSEVAFIMGYDPRLLILDEPFAGLDPLTIKRIVGILNDSKASTKVLIADHNITALQELADWFVLLKDGKILCNKPSNSFFKDPVVRQRFLG